MSDVVTELLASHTPDAPDTSEATEKPEVVEQESREEVRDESPESETAEVAAEGKTDDEKEQLRKKAFALERRVNRQAAEKNRALGEVDSLKSRLEQFEQALRRQHQQQNPQEARQYSQEEVEREIQQRVQQVSQAVERDSKVVSKIEAIQERSPKFVDGLREISDYLGPLHTPHGMPTPALDVILECDHPDKVVEYLRRNPEEASKLEGLTPTRLTREFLKIEALATKKPVSAAPAPLKPLNGSGRSDKSADNMSAEELWSEVKPKR
jgi:hypothetical protein